MPAIVRYHPWSLLRGLQDDVNQIFEQNLDKSLGEWRPQVDITEQPNAYSVVADLPGINPKNIEVSMEGATLTIKGERKSEQKKESDGYTRIERSTGSFFRQFTLPDNIDSSKIQAKSNHGVLELTIPKKQATTPVKIEVKVE